MKPLALARTRDVKLAPGCRAQRADFDRDAVAASAGEALSGVGQVFWPRERLCEHADGLTETQDGSGAGKPGTLNQERAAGLLVGHRCPQ